MSNDSKPRTADLIWLLFSVGVAVAALVLAIFAPGHGPRGLWIMIVAVSWLAVGLSLAPFRPQRAGWPDPPAGT